MEEIFFLSIVSLLTFWTYETCILHYNMIMTLVVSFVRTLISLIVK